MLPQVTQEIRVVEEYDKKRALYEILEKVMDGSKVLIFTSTKRTADDLTSSLRQDGWPARAIHGDKVGSSHTAQLAPLPLSLLLVPLALSSSQFADVLLHLAHPSPRSPCHVCCRNQSQSERDWVLQEFRSGKSPLMIATDVASRGLDVKDIKASSQTHTHALVVPISMPGIDLGLVRARMAV